MSGESSDLPERARDELEPSASAPASSAQDGELPAHASASGVTAEVVTSMLAELLGADASQRLQPGAGRAPRRTSAEDTDAKTEPGAPAQATPVAPADRAAPRTTAAIPLAEEGASLEADATLEGEPRPGALDVEVDALLEVEVADADAATTGSSDEVETLRAALASRVAPDVDRGADVDADPARDGETQGTRPLTDDGGPDELSDLAHAGAATNPALQSLEASHPLFGLPPEPLGALLALMDLRARARKRDLDQLEMLRELAVEALQTRLQGALAKDVLSRQELTELKLLAERKAELHPVVGEGNLELLFVELRLAETPLEQAKVAKELYRLHRKALTAAPSRPATDTATSDDGAAAATTGASTTRQAASARAAEAGAGDEGAVAAGEGRGAGVAGDAEPGAALFGARRTQAFDVAAQKVDAEHPLYGLPASAMGALIALIENRARGRRLDL